MYLFGGQSFDYKNDIWKYIGNQWHQVRDFNNKYGNYVDQGKSSQISYPSARLGASYWIDKSGYMWMYGGQNEASLCDLWKLDLMSFNWTWIKTENCNSNSNSQLLPNSPGPRVGSTTWVDLLGNFWMFGGSGKNGANNDLWMLCPTGKWLFVLGNTTNATASIPDSREYASSWVNSYGSLFLFGGYNGNSNFNDLWELQVPEIPNCSETAAPYTSPPTFNSVATSPSLSSIGYIHQEQHVLASRDVAIICSVGVIVVVIIIMITTAVLKLHRHHKDAVDLPEGYPIRAISPCQKEKLCELMSKEEVVKVFAEKLEFSPEEISHIKTAEDLLHEWGSSPDATIEQLLDIAKEMPKPNRLIIQHLEEILSIEDSLSSQGYAIKEISQYKKKKLCDLMNSEEVVKVFAEKLEFPPEEISHIKKAEELLHMWESSPDATIEKLLESAREMPEQNIFIIQHLEEILRIEDSLSSQGYAIKDILQHQKKKLCKLMDSEDVVKVFAEKLEFPPEEIRHIKKAEELLHMWELSPDATIEKLLKIAKGVDSKFIINYLRQILRNIEKSPRGSQRHSICGIPHQQRRKLIGLLEQENEFRGFAEKLGYTDIDLRILKTAEKWLFDWEARQEATIEKLLMVAKDVNNAPIIELLEGL